MLRKLSASIVASDGKKILMISGLGDVIEPDDDIMGIGSGAAYATSAARALYNNTRLSAKDIVLKSMEIAAGICLYTNNNFSLVEIKNER